jgi:hypothetical protein
MITIGILLILINLFIFGVLDEIRNILKSK